jgi:hypothetical protein
MCLAADDKSILHRSPPVGQVPEPSPQEDQRSRLRHNGIAPRVVPNYEAV